MPSGPGEFTPQITSHNTPTSKRSGMRLCECVMFSQNSCACNGNRVCPFQTEGCRGWRRGSASGMNRGKYGGRFRRPEQLLTPTSCQMWGTGWAFPSEEATGPNSPQAWLLLYTLWPRAGFQPTLLFWPAWWPALCSELKEMTTVLVPPVLKPAFMAIWFRLEFSQTWNAGSWLVSGSALTSCLQKYWVKRRGSFKKRHLLPCGPKNFTTNSLSPLRMVTSCLLSMLENG